MILLIIAVMTLITFINRYLFFATAISYQPGSRVRRFLSYSSYAVLTAIWLPIVLEFDASQGFSHAGNDYLLATLVAVLLAVMRVKSILVVVLSTTLFFTIRFY